MADADITARLRAIVLRHTVVGGYPDTMAIARDAYALDRVEPMTLERTVWRGDVSREETQELEDWIATARDEELQRLLTGDFPATDEEGQAFLAIVWNDADDDHAGLLDGRQMSSREDRPTYHWGDGERRAFRRAVERLRPGYLDPHPGQGSLL